MRFLTLILLIVCCTQEANAEIKRLTFYFGEKSDLLTYDSDSLIQSLKEDLNSGEYEIQWLEMYSYAENENSGRALRLSQRRSLNIRKLLNIENDSITVRDLGNVKCAVKFEIEGWNRVDLYFWKIKKTTQSDLSEFSFQENEETTVKLFFMSSSTKINPGSESELERIRDLFIQNPYLKAEIRGHVCCGNKKSLSKKRAEIIFNYLVRNGIEESRLTYVGYSNSEPLVTPELTDLDRSLNRRTEIVFHFGSLEATSEFTIESTNCD